MPFGPRVIAQAPSTAAFTARLDAERRDKSLFTGEGVQEAIAGINDIRQLRAERRIREGILDEDRNPFGQTLSRAGEAGRSGANIPTLGSFDPGSGNFRRPVFPPAFNPNASDPRTGGAGGGVQQPDPRLRTGARPAAGGALGPAGAGLVPNDRSGRFDPEVDQRIRDFQVNFGDSDTTQALIEQRKRQRALSDQIAAVGDLPPRTQRLIRAGVITPREAFEGLQAQEAEERQVHLNQRVFERLRAANPDDPNFREFLPGVNYVEEFGNELERAADLELERFKQGAQTKRTQIQERGRTQRTNIQEAGRDRRASNRPDAVSPDDLAAAFNLLTAGFSRQEAIDNLIGGRDQQGGTVTADRAVRAVAEAGKTFDEARGEEPQRSPAGIRAAAQAAARLADENGLSREDVLRDLSTRGLTPEQEELFMEEFDSAQEF